MGRTINGRYVYQWELDGKRRPLPSLCRASEQYGDVTVIRPQYVPDGLCQWCGEPITERRRKTTCSDKCKWAFDKAATWEARGGYAKHLLRRNNFTCQDCGEFHAMKNKHGVYVPTSDGELEIHHIVLVSEGGSDAPGNLVALCKACHLRRHGKEATQ